MSGNGTGLLAALLVAALLAAACTEASNPESLVAGSGSDEPTSVATDPAEPADETTTVGPEAGGYQCWAAPAAAGVAGIGFSDATEAAGLYTPLTGMHAHAAAWGDLDDDGAVDLFVGTFADRPVEKYQVRGATEAAPDRILTSEGATFVDGGLPPAYGRTSGVAFVDLDGDFDLDLVLSRNVKASRRDDGGAAALPTAVYENSDGRLLERPDSGIDPTLGGRSVAVFDFDNDRLYDLFIVEDRYRGGSSRLYRNLGGFQFEDVTESAGLPADLHGLGVATADVDRDGDVDFFVAGSNVLFVADQGGFRAASSDIFEWNSTGAEDDVAGAAFGDVDRDGLPDLVVGHHFGSTLSGGAPAPVRLFLNRTTTANELVFVESTANAGLVGIPTKAPHVEIVDFDNDGWPDILTSASAEEGTAPAIFRNEGASDGTVRFTAPEGLGNPQYWVTAPTADYDRDGRVDLLLVEWEPSLPSILLKNESESGSWLSVSVDPTLGHGFGGWVVAYESGGLGNPERVVGSADITASRGYAAGVEAVAHLGLGVVAAVDLEIATPWGGTLELRDVAVNQSIRVPAGCTSGS